MFRSDCLEVIVRFVDIGRIVDHHCLEVLVRCADIGGFFKLSLHIYGGTVEAATTRYAYLDPLMKSVAITGMRSVFFLDSPTKITI